MVPLRLVVVLLLAAAAARALPASERFAWIPDADGRLHMVDLLEAEDEDAPVPYFDGDKDVTLSLYTKKNPTVAERITFDPSTSPSFNNKHPTRFVMHGWTSSGKRMDDFRKAYMETGKDFNVVMVDWKGLAAWEYSISKRHSRRVGEHVAEIVAHLVTDRGVRLDDIYLVGHSLGGQGMGVAGHRLTESIGQVAHIVGLDAAQPLFLTTSEKNRLDPSDAKYVQGMHTNGGVLGWESPLGHIDFFPNGGSDQAGCILDVTGACSHNKAPPFYVESITSQDFVGTLCHTYKAFKKGSCDHNPTAVMGEWTTLGTAGNYFMKTNSKSPYGQGI